MTDAELAGFATERWVENVGAVPPEEIAAMVCEDPSVVTCLVGALRHARLERDAARAEVRERDKKLSAIAPIITVVDNWDWTGLVRDAKNGDIEAAEDAIAELAEATKGRP